MNKHLFDIYKEVCKEHQVYPLIGSELICEAIERYVNELNEYVKCKF